MSLAKCLRRGPPPALTTLLALLSWALQATPAAASGTGLDQDVVFSEYTPLSSSAELMRRLLTPLAAAQVESTLAHSARQLIAQPVDLAHERFVLYVPPAAPAHGYGLLVFVPPWDSARLPGGWAPVLDHYGMIFVSAARSGNEANVIGRREPLALLAAYNVTQRYPVDAERVYVGGFSGGSRIALRLAVGFPDVFRGALLNAGSDALGTQVPLPPAQLWRQFQESSRIVYLTGEQDGGPLAADADSRRSLGRWCVYDVHAQVTPDIGHEVASAAALEAALRRLLAPEPASSRLAACRAGVDRELAAGLDKVQSLLAGGQRTAARQQLIEIDRRFGALAAPRSIELRSALN